MSKQWMTALALSAMAAGCAIEEGNSVTQQLCDPGATQACSCEDGRAGALSCDEVGNTWGACVCTGEDVVADLGDPGDPSVTDPADPRVPPEGAVVGDPIVQLGFVTQQPGPHLLELVPWGDDRVLVCTGRQGIELFDVSDPSHSKVISKKNPSLGTECEKVALDAATSRVYTSHSGDMKQPQPAITVFDFSNESSPQILGYTETDELVSGMAVWGDYLLVAAHSAGLLVFERGAGAALTRVGELATNNAWHVAVVESDAAAVAYVADGTTGLAIIDLSDPSEPTRITQLALQGEASQLVVDGDRAYVALSGAGIALLDISDPAAPSVLEFESSPGSVKTVAYSASTRAVYASAWNDVRVFDLTDRNNLVLMGREAIPRDNSAENRCLAVAAIGDVIFASNWDQFTTYRYTPGNLAGDLWLSVDTITQQNIEIDETVFKAIFLENHGTLPLEVTVGKVSDGLTVQAFDSTLAVGGFTEVIVSYTATSTKAYKGSVELLSDDPDQPLQKVGFEFNQPGLGVGSQTPDFLFDQLYGGTVNLSDFQGAPVMLAYFATF